MHCYVAFLSFVRCHSHILWGVPVNCSWRTSFTVISNGQFVNKTSTFNKPLNSCLNMWPLSCILLTDLSIDDLLFSFREELTSGIKRFISHRFTSSRNGLPYVSTSLKCLMLKRDTLHARKDCCNKTIKHEVQKKLCAAYWQCVEELITPTNNEDSMGANKRLWSLFNHSKSDSNGIPPLKRHGNLITNVAGKAIVLNSYFQSVFTSHVPLATSSKSTL